MSDSLQSYQSILVEKELDFEKSTLNEQELLSLNFYRVKENDLKKQKLKMTVNEDIGD